MRHKMLWLFAIFIFFLLVDPRNYFFLKQKEKSIFVVKKNGAANLLPFLDWLSLLNWYKILFVCSKN